MTDNFIEADGARAIGEGLKTNSKLIHLFFWCQHNDYQGTEEPNVFLMVYVIQVTSLGTLEQHH